MPRRLALRGRAARRRRPDEPTLTLTLTLTQLAAADPTSLLGQMAPYVRLNMQVRVYGAGEAYGLTELLKRGYDYVR